MHGTLRREEIGIKVTSAPIGDNIEHSCSLQFQKGQMYHKPCNGFSFEC